MRSGHAGRCPDERAAQDMAAFYEAQRSNPDLVPFVGPEDSLQRFLSGGIVRREEFVTDQSLFTIKALLPAQMKRLQWMLDHGSA